VCAVLRLVRVGDASPFRRVRHEICVAFDDYVETVKRVLARREHTMRIRGEVLRLAFARARAEVGRAVEPHAEQRRDMRAAFRANGREPIHPGILELTTPARPLGRDGVGITERGAEFRHRARPGNISHAAMIARPTPAASTSAKWTST